MKRKVIVVLLSMIVFFLNAETIKAESGGDLIEKDLFDTSLTVDYGRRKMTEKYQKSSDGRVVNVSTKEQINDYNKTEKPSFTSAVYSAKFIYGITDYINFFVNAGTILDEFKDINDIAKSEAGMYGGGGLRAGYKFQSGFYLAGTGIYNMGRATNYNFNNGIDSKNNIYEWEGNLMLGYDIRVNQSFRIIPYLGGRYSDRYSKFEVAYSNRTMGYEYAEFWSKRKFGGFGGMELRLTKQLSFKAEVGLGDKDGFGAALTYRFGIE